MSYRHISSGEYVNKSGPGLLVEIVLGLVVVALFVSAVIIILSNAKEGQKTQDAFAQAETEKNNQEFAADQKVDWVVLGEGYYDHADYALTGKQVTVVYFSDGRTIQMGGVIDMEYPKGSKIRISQLRTGAGTAFEKRKDKYKIELLDAEGK